jgi:hypothetical protein
MLCNLPFKSNCVPFLIRIYFWCYFSGKLKWRKLLGSPSKSEVSNNAQPNQSNLGLQWGYCCWAGCGLPRLARSSRSTSTFFAADAEAGDRIWWRPWECTLLLLHADHQEAQAQLRALLRIAAGDLICDMLAFSRAHLLCRWGPPTSLTSGSRFGSLWTGQELGYGVCWHV